MCALVEPSDTAMRTLKPGRRSASPALRRNMARSREADRLCGYQRHRIEERRSRHPARSFARSRTLRGPAWSPILASSPPPRRMRPPFLNAGEHSAPRPLSSPTAMGKAASCATCCGSTLKRAARRFVQSPFGEMRAASSSGAWLPSPVNGRCTAWTASPRVLTQGCSWWRAKKLQTRPRSNSRPSLFSLGRAEQAASGGPIWRRWKAAK
jgi:hypothetical protein